MKKIVMITILTLICAVPVAEATPVLFSDVAVNAAGITPIRDAFRAAIGGGVVPGPAGSFGGVRREINWDAVPDLFAAPNNLPADFFNTNSPRGVVYSTPGTGFQVSANAGIAPIEFGNLNPNYPNNFAAFSAQRLFTALGSTITDINFFVPGTNKPARTSAFGAIFTDVDRAGTTIEYFDAQNNSLGVFAVPNIAGNQTFSFLGVVFDSPIVSRVRIDSGNIALGPTASDIHDVVAMDDFIYAEPVRVPEPDTLVLAGFGLTALALWIRRRARA